MGDANAGRLHALDYLRFFAAMGVLLTHHTFAGWETGDITAAGGELPVATVTRYGYLGVHLFFLISGFVILNSTRGKTARQFAVSRAVRLLPAFWLSLLATAAVLAAWGWVVGRQVTATQVIGNLTMTPALIGFDDVDRAYWTLLIEVEFYLAVLVLMLIGLTPWLGRLLPWWALAMLGVEIFHPTLGSVPYLGGFFSLFAGGALIAEIRHAGWSPLRVAALAASAYVSLQVTIDHTSHMVSVNGYWISVPTACVVVIGCHAAMLTICIPQVSRLRLPGAATLGAITYPVYLIHQEVGYIVISVFATEQNRGWVVIGVAVLVIAYALLVNRLVEQRYRRTWVSIFDSTLGRAIWTLEKHKPVTQAAMMQGQESVPAR
jgi:peptidoglycan/LPS O-acetylase OafA/YrhL